MSLRNVKFSFDQNESRQLCHRAPAMFYNHDGDQFESMHLKIDHRRGELSAIAINVTPDQTRQGAVWRLSDEAPFKHCEFPTAENKVPRHFASVAVRGDLHQLVPFSKEDFTADELAKMYGFGDEFPYTWKDYSLAGISLGWFSSEIRVFGWAADGGLTLLKSIPVELTALPRCMAFSFGSNCFAHSTGSTITVRNADGEIVRQLDLTSPVLDVELSPDGTAGVAVIESASNDGSCALVEFSMEPDATVAALAVRIENIPGKIRGMRFSPDTRFLGVTSGEDGMLLYDCANWQLLGHYADAVSIPVFSSDSRLMWYGVRVGQTAVQAVRLPRL